MTSRRRTFRLLGDGAAAVAALWAAFLVRVHVPLPWTRGLLPEDRLRFLSREWLVVLALQFASLYFFGFYDAPRPRGRAELARRLALASTFQAMALMAWWFLANRDFPRSVALLFVAFDFTLLFGWRVFLDRTERRRERRVAIAGSGAAARELARSLAREPWHGLKVAGWVTIPGEATAEGEEPALGPCLGSTGDLPALLADGRIDDILVVGSSDSWQTRLIDGLAGTRPDHTSVLLLPGPFESLIGRMRYRWVHDLPLIEVVRETEWRINWPLKRLLDLAAGSLLLAAASPAMAACALAVRLTSPGDVLYRQTRVGRGQKPFTLYKFRTMRQDAEAESGEVLAQPGDPRLTPIGAWLRRFRLDELPQLFNVLQGTMSLVGPRPERPGFVQRYLREVPGYAERFSLAPGLTGLAQVNGDYYSSPQNKLRYDLAYMANWTLWLDLSILLRTVKIVLTSQGV
ncbi:MAG TPA: sugar transferase [Thermoanaerobaculia bacterium]|jgi:exopolysaccharide biosynthesis polyprenyl glycosylphosphotransferase